MAKGGGLSRGRVGNRILSLYPARFYCRLGLSGIGTAGLIRIDRVQQGDMPPFGKLFRSLAHSLRREGTSVATPPISPVDFGLVQRHVRQFEAVTPE